MGTRSRKQGSFSVDRATPPHRKKGCCTTAILTGFIVIKMVIFENREFSGVFFAGVDTQLRKRKWPLSDWQTGLKKGLFTLMSGIDARLGR